MGKATHFQPRQHSHMSPITRTVERIAVNPLFVVASGLATLICFCSTAVAWFSNGSVYWWVVVVGLAALALFLAGFLYSVVVRRENLAFRDMPDFLHKINHHYRDVLSSVFNPDEPSPEQKKILATEESTIRSVCQRIARIFTRLIGRDCTVTVKLLASGHDGHKYCQTYARSEENSVRDQHSGAMQFRVGSGDNTAFDQALRPAPAGDKSYFHSGDLQKEKDRYRNERQHYWKHYRSTIVVPIRYQRCDKIGTPDATDDIGFLCVDTRSRNRLNDTYHVDIMCCFADQMYNFFSLMRGRYSLSSAQGTNSSCLNPT